MAPRSPYYFDKDAARRAVEFFPRFLRLPSAEWYGRPFHLNKTQASHRPDFRLAQARRHAAL
jgi:hypothetical protein